VDEIVTGEAVVLDLPYARFPTRMLAHLIDMVLQLLVLGIITIAAVAGAVAHRLDSASLAAVGVSTGVAVIVGYPAAFETLSRGRTIGKLALGLRVVADDGGPERFRPALVRALAGAVECWLLMGVPALIAAMLSARGKRLGDIFAGTFVIRERAPRPGRAVYQGTGKGAGSRLPPMDPALRGWAAQLDLSALPEPVAVAAATYLSRYWQLNAAIRDQLGQQFAADVAARVTPPPPPSLPPAMYLHTVLVERGDRELVRWQAASVDDLVTAAPVASSAPPSPAAPPPAARPVTLPPPANDGGFAPPI
jgi:uncharacterized RDD family membrane protein YckC